MSRIAVIGGGAWGTALALVAARAGHPVTLWARDGGTVGAINTRHENPHRLPGVALPGTIVATHDIAIASAAEIVVLAVPAQATRAIAEAAAHTIAPATPVIAAAPGTRDGLRLSVGSRKPCRMGWRRSGPSFAADVARGLPTAARRRRPRRWRSICRALAADVPPVRGDGRAGVELGGVIKRRNRRGIVAGRKLGASALAALTARGFAELRRFAEALGARPETLMGLSGLGDLVLTCSGPQSRNFAYGLALGVGQPPPASLAEGV